MAKAKKKITKKKTSSTTAKPRKKKAADQNLSLFDADGDAEPASKAPSGGAASVERTKKPAGARGKAARTERETAQSIGARQREISVSEFFAKNRHMLGFDSPSRAILTAVKEAVDNSLDACEEAGLLPEIIVEIKELSEDRYLLIVEDSGPGIVKAQVPKIFGKLLYGSKFHQLKQTRGQQGIGISAAVMYSQLTTGKPVRVTSRTGAKHKAHLYEMQIDTKKNMPVILDEDLLGAWLAPKPLSPARLDAVLQPCNSDRLEAFPVSALVNSPANDQPECIQRLEPAG